MVVARRLRAGRRGRTPAVAGDRRSSRPSRWRSVSVALADGLGESAALATAGVALLRQGGRAAGAADRGSSVARREPRLIVEERHALARGRRRGDRDADARRARSAAGTRRAGGARTAPSRCSRSGMAIAVLRRAAIFQALGFLVAENGLYVAALAAPGGPAGGDRDRRSCSTSSWSSPSPPRSAPRSTSTSAPATRPARGAA